ncbi:MAG: hypothetical protein ACTHM4_05580 [Rhodanobacteraceae bacterium]
MSGPNALAGVNVVAHVQVDVRRDRAGGADAGFAAREVQRRKAVGHRRDVVGAEAGRVEQVFVHHHEARQQGLAARVDHGGADRHFRIGRGTKFGDAALDDHQRLVMFRRRTGAIDDRGVDEGNDRLLVGDPVVRIGVREWRERQQCEQQNECAFHDVPLRRWVPVALRARR